MARLISLATAFAVLVAMAPLQAQQQRPAPPGIEEAAAMENYLGQRWLLLQTRVLLRKIKPEAVMEGLASDAQRLGTRGPSMADAAVVEGDLAIEADAYLNSLENRIRGGQAKWPADKPATRHANEALIELELIRAELKEARADKRDQFPPMVQAGRIFLRSGGEPATPEPFDGRDEAVMLAMQKIRLAPQSPRR